MDKQLLKILQSNSPELKAQKGQKILEPYLEAYAKMLLDANDPIMDMKAFEVQRYQKYYSQDGFYSRLDQVIIKMFDYIVDSSFGEDNKFILYGRLKTLFSAANKWERTFAQINPKNPKNLFNEIHDYAAYRIVLFNNDDSHIFEIVKIIKEFFKKFYPVYLTAKCKDYISTPKSNGYKSYHIIIRDPASEMIFEIQIRTTQQHLNDEYGPASWKTYKAGKYEEQLNYGEDDILKLRVPGFEAERFLTPAYNNDLPTEKLMYIDYAGLLTPITLISKPHF